MGQSQSNPTTSSLTPITTKPKRRVPRLLRRLSCTSAKENSASLSGDTLHEKHSYESFKLTAISVPHVTAARHTDATFADFIREFPEYSLTWMLDDLRRDHFGRLRRLGETYVDYMGGSLYPDTLVHHHAALLQQSIMGNTHSINNSSALSSFHADQARSAVLTFFRAPPEYTVIFTANASAALKLVGEAFPFAEKSSYVLAEDSHNSVHGIRQFAARAGAKVSYIPAEAHGGFDAAQASSILEQGAPSEVDAHSLFALTGQSNISNFKAPLDLLKHASSLGYNTLLDAAALAATSTINLEEIDPDAMAISFYKMFGYPTGVGALVVKRTFLTKLARPWFAGGTVDVVQVPGSIVTMSPHVHERFEDGTINYLSLPAITNGLRFLAPYLPLLPLRLSTLTRYLIASLEAIRYLSGAPVVRVLSTRPGRRLRHIGEQSDAGSVVSVVFLSPDGNQIPNAMIAHATAARGISLRTGCMCNSGGAAALLGLKDAMAHLECGATLAAFERAVGEEVGIVRVSLGLASDFGDVCRVLAFAREVADERARGDMRIAWERDPATRLGVGYDSRA